MPPKDLPNCSRYPIKKYILERDEYGKTKVKELFLYKYPVNNLPPPSLDD